MSVGARENDIRHLKEAQLVAQKALETGKHPFGAILVNPDGSLILDSQGNIDTVNHAESTLARRAAANYDPAYLWNCTIYTTVEPCCMCSGTIYWANIGRVVYGLTEDALLGITGNHQQNPTMSLSCEEVFSHGQKPIEVVYISSMASTIADAHLDFWS